ncbi:hypothetical protein [Variovorax sp. Sphag1AA]|uniref:hypothetical protein n=1 Tax=Variovorax sp. Sphag1AA TaxID=2587027 RepID=UPI00161EE869|nr:hypothetical protein [Variovorax sp. Sphag1AA]MBB3181163.1 hypothetical protein [Variovorax sp. Sphag1AA]
MNASFISPQAISDSTPTAQAEQAILPSGQFIKFPREAAHSKLPARLRNLPVLHGTFNHELFDLNPNLPAYVGFGQSGTIDTNILTFRLQRGPNMLYWLANPADPCVWEALDLWAAAGALVLMAEFSNGETLLLSRSFELAPRTQALKSDVSRASTMTPRFREAAFDIIGTGNIRHMATTDIPAYPTLNHVQGCMVATPFTPRGPAADIRGTWDPARFLIAEGSPPVFMSSVE